jgi:hypothetical protein
MTGETIRQFMLRDPFVPFDLKMADGRRYTVDHREFIAITRDLGQVLYQTQEDDRTLWIDTAEIIAIEAAGGPAVG